MFETFPQISVPALLEFDHQYAALISQHIQIDNLFLVNGFY